MSCLRIFLALLLCIACSGCGETYPKEKLGESVVKVCKDEYKIDVKAQVFGATLAVFIPLPSLLDLTFGITDEAQEVIQNVLLAASRIVLSTDALPQFYCIIAQDARIPEIQVIIIKYVDDVKRSFYSDIPRSEYFKRTLFDININPQSKKEQNINEIFEKYNLDKEWQEDVLEEFFRSTPMALREFGYWNDKFYVKDITLPEFLAEQMAYRIKMRFREEPALSKKYTIKDVQGSYVDENGGKNFDLKFDIKMNELLAVMGEPANDKELYKNIFEEIADCLYGYQFTDFGRVRVLDVNRSKNLLFPREDIWLFKKNKMKIDTIIGAI